MRRPDPRGRSGSASVEAALVLPPILLFLLAILVGAFGVFSYHELAAVTREAARYASVRGTRYEAATAKAAATPQSVYDNAIRPRLITLNPNRLAWSVTWNSDNRPGSDVVVSTSYNWLPVTVFGSTQMTSTVSQTVTW